MTLFPILLFPPTFRYALFPFYIFCLIFPFSYSPSYWLMVLGLESLVDCDKVMYHSALTSLYDTSGIHMVAGIYFLALLNLDFVK